MKKPESRQRQRKHTLDTAADPQAPTLSVNPLTEELVPEEPPKRFARTRKFLKRFFLGLLVVLIIAGLWFGWKLYRDTSKLTGNNNPWQLVTALWPKAPKETDGRINILLTGFSKDDPGHSGAELTDSIMVLSINPETKKALTLSIPRDLYVNIPGHGYSKINAAYEYGEADDFSEIGYADGGMGLLQKIIEQNFGITTNYSALINYTAFRDMVNAVGGVKVTIKSQDPRGLYDPYANLKIPNGTFELNGQTALNLARSRGDGPGSYGLPLADFDRTQHQRQILIALKDKIGTGSLWLNPLKVIRLADALGNNVRTNFKLNEMSGLYNVMRKVKDKDIVSIGLNDYHDKNLLGSYTTGDGQSALIPAAGVDDYTQIKAALAKEFSK
jgi:LCP family protein required for cell wall assembly